MPGLGVVRWRGETYDAGSFLLCMQTDSDLELSGFYFARNESGIWALVGKWACTRIPFCLRMVKRLKPYRFSAIDDVHCIDGYGV